MTELSIREVSRITQVPAYTLRYWEDRFKLLRPVRLKSGHRRYSKRDVDLVLKIKELLYQRKLTLAGAKKILVEWGRPRPDGVSQAPEDQHFKGLIADVQKEIRELLDELN